MRSALLVVAIVAGATVGPRTAHACPASPSPPPAPAPSCPAPPDATLARARAAIDRAIEPGHPPPDLIVSCPVAGGWLIGAAFTPRATFTRGVAPPCPAAAGDCGVQATWRLSPRGDATLLPGVVLAPSLDVDGDGVAESVTHDARGATSVWFANRRRPVTLTGVGQFAPRAPGQVWLVADGDADAGFVRATARAFRVGPSGAIAQPALVEPMWQDTRAARCPAISAAPPVAVAPPIATSTCPGPPPSVAAALTASLVTTVTARARDLGAVLGELDHPGASRLDVTWSCSRQAPLALVTYCLRRDDGGCDSAEAGLLHHELWGRRAGTMVLLERVASTTEAMEWNIHQTIALVGSPDLDGDGDPDAMILDTEREDGAIDHVVVYRGFVGGGFVKLVSVTCSRRCPSATVVPAAAGARDAVVVSASTGSDGVAVPARAYRLIDGHLRPLTGAAARVALRRARALATP